MAAEEEQYDGNEEEHQPYDDSDWDERKVFLSRIPLLFDSSSVKRLMEENLGGEGTIVNVSLAAKAPDEEHSERKRKTDKEEHRGFAFVTMKTVELQQKALELGTIRGGAKATSNKKFTIYILPVVRGDDNNEGLKQLCFLYNKFRCPYGDDCKFLHQGEGGCIEKNGPSKKRKKCFAYKKGKCKLGDACPHSHDFEVKQCIVATKKESRPDNEKDCINWKSKGKCRKGDKCPYRHDPDKQKKKRKNAGDDDSSKTEKTRQPLSIRVYGLNYETNEQHVREFFQDCGKIVEITFPRFEDSGRSKGYCGVLFQSPKAVAKAVAELDGKELHGRWLRVQAGKMYLKQWEEHHATPEMEEEAPKEEPLIGEFGQKVKRRKKHGYAE